MFRHTNTKTNTNTNTNTSNASSGSYLYRPQMQTQITYRDIIVAIATEDLDSVKRLVNASNVNDIIDEQNGFTALHIAITKSYGKQITNYLLSIGGSPDIKVKSVQIPTSTSTNSLSSTQIDGYDLAIDHRKRFVFDHSINKARTEADNMAVKNDVLRTQLTESVDKVKYLETVNSRNSERLRTEVEPIKIENVRLKEQLKQSNKQQQQQHERITKMYDEKRDECNTLKRKLEVVTEDNVKLKRDLTESENALSIMLKKHKK